MPDRNPLISICIPTYNRKKYLKECLDSIITQKSFNEDDIEIIISDNASIDDTSTLVYDYQTRYKNIKYFRNTTNLGPVKNILWLPNYAKGDYIWFLSDDDMMNSISLEFILEAINNIRPWLILSRMYGFSDWDVINLEDTNISWETIVLKWMNDFLNFLSKVRYDITPYLMAFSIFCFRRDVYMRNLQILLEENWWGYQEVLNNDYFPHSRIIFLPFGTDEKIVIFEKDLILGRGNNISWTFHFSICQDLLRLIKDLKKKYSMTKSTYKKLMNIYYYSVFSYVVIVHLQRYMPKFLYNFCVFIGKKWIQFIREQKLKE